MRVEICDGNGCGYRIDSSDPELIGRWFAEQSWLLMSANSCFQPSIRIWPVTSREMEILSGPQRLTEMSYRMSQEGLLELAEHILHASARLAELETEHGPAAKP